MNKKNAVTLTDKEAQEEQRLGAPWNAQKVWARDQFGDLWRIGRDYHNPALDGDLRSAPGRRNKEIDDGGLDDYYDE